MENTRVSELAKELGMTSKDVIEKFAEIDITVKSHSNVVTPQQIRRLKEHLGQKDAPAKKPKAFIVKKAKPVEVQEIEKAEAPVEKKANKPLIEVVKRKERPVETVVAETPVEEVKEEVKVEKKPIKVERTKIEYPDRNKSRIEIVRKAPPKPLVEKVERRPRPEGKQAEGQNGEKRPFKKDAGQEKKLVERRIIPQEMYDNKGFSKKKADGKTAYWQELQQQAESCFICDKIDYNMARYYETFFALLKEPEFRQRVEASKGFCLRHFGQLLEASEKHLPNSQREWFYKAVFKLMEDNLVRVKEDLDWFVSMFDYRQAGADWKNSRDAVPRAMQKLQGLHPADPVFKKEP